MKRVTCFIVCVGATIAAHAQRGDGGAAVASDTLGANYVVVSERIHTAGQPNAETLANLGERGFELVVNLAPPTSPDAVAEEGKLVAASGAAYVNIPVNWQQPTTADFDLFSAVMNGARDKQVLVHCQLNMRASAFTFLYRVVHGGVAPEAAFEGLSQVWVPRDQWADFVNSTLAAHGIDYRLPAAPPPAAQ
jgi:protein tyrosine phosphatase (PTP) superfamily phosphohydrolase (DUF442 family)